MNKKNPHSICTWSDGEKCKSCKLHNHLICRQDKDFRRKFMLSHLNFRATIFFGMVYIGTFSGIWLPLIIYSIAFILNFAIIEPRMLCSHCPFYAEKGIILHCNTLFGMPKIWKYRPGPIKKYEMIIQFISGSLVDLLPLIFFGYGIYLLVLLNAKSSDYVAFSAIIFFHILLLLQLQKVIMKEVCTKCPNFSCALNKVPKDIKIHYIKNNPVIKDAWEKAGYKIEE